jgi:hypothetical protein
MAIRARIALRIGLLRITPSSPKHGNDIAWIQDDASPSLSTSKRKRFEAMISLLESEHRDFTSGVQSFEPGCGRLVGWPAHPPKSKEMDVAGFFIVSSPFLDSLTFKCSYTLCIA